MEEGREKPKGMTVEEAGRKGGEVTASRYGHDFYQAIGHKGGEKVKQKYGPDFYHQIGKRGGQKVKELIRQAKELNKQKSLEVTQDA